LFIHSWNLQITGKHSKNFLKNAKNINLIKIKWILNSEIQGNRGDHFLHLACQGSGAHPCPPSVTPLFMGTRNMLLEKSYSLLSVFYTRSRRLSRLTFFTNNIFHTQEIKNDDSLIFFYVSYFHARNQLGTPGGAKSFLREAQIF